MAKKIVEKPLVCCLDLKDSDFDALKAKGFNMFKGTLGNVIKLSGKDTVALSLNSSFPPNVHEYDILILDLNNENQIEYDPKEHLFGDVREKSIPRFVSGPPLTLFDPRPFAASLLREEIHQTMNREFVQIVFACADYVLHYEIRDFGEPHRTDGYQPHSNSIYDFSPFISPSTQLYGNSVTICEDASELLTLLKKHIDNLEYHQTFTQPTEPFKANFVPLLRNKNGNIVSYAHFTRTLNTFVFPDILNKGDFLVELLQNVLPSIMPSIFPHSTQFKWKKDFEYYLPNQLALLTQRDAANEEYQVKLKTIDDATIENEKQFGFLHELITETGETLVNAVQKFFIWLGFNKVILKDHESKSILEEDLQIELEDGLLILEIKGIGGTSTDSDCSQISKIKFRRCRERQAFDVSALYVVNHQKHLPPLDRKNPPFTEHQITDAENDQRGLVTTWQLFNLYFDIENGIVTKEEAKKEMIKFGLLDFKPTLKAILPEPTEILKNGTVIIVEIQNTLLKVGQILIVKKNGRHFKTVIESIQLDGVAVTEIDNGEIGLKLGTRIERGSILGLV